MLVTILAAYTGSIRVEIETVDLDAIPREKDIINFQADDSIIVTFKVLVVEWNISSISTDVDLYVSGTDKESRDYLERVIKAKEEEEGYREA